MASTILVEKLIKTVSRAFYTDNVVILLDALIREKYIKEEELGPRLKLPNKEIRKLLLQLNEEMIVKYEDITIDERTSKCWYIDYQLFTHVVRYRIHKIKSEILSKEKLELNHIFFQCPSCSEKYSELQVQRLISKDYKFICAHCCPSNDFRNTLSLPYFTLIEQDSGNQLSEVQKLERKMTAQFTQSDNHDGIFDLLSELRNEYIIRNLPSENIKRGLVTSKVTDEDVLQRIEENTSHTGGRKKAKTNSDNKDNEDNLKEPKFFNVENVSQSTNSSLTSGHSTTPMLVPQKEKAMPSFLLGSRIVDITIGNDNNNNSSNNNSHSNNGSNNNSNNSNDNTNSTTTNNNENNENQGGDDDDEWED